MVSRSVLWFTDKNNSKRHFCTLTVNLRNKRTSLYWFCLMMIFCPCVTYISAGELKKKPAKRKSDARTKDSVNFSLFVYVFCTYVIAPTDNIQIIFCKHFNKFSLVTNGQINRWTERQTDGQRSKLASRFTLW